ncbi:MAG: acyl-CoA carboxylase subunit beta, partial [Pseudonocardiaceae bacterium]
FMVENTSYMFITGPDVVRTVTGEEVTVDELGGARSHATRSGVATFTAPNDRACLAEVRRLLSFLPANCTESPPVGASFPQDKTEPGHPVDPGVFLPASSNDPYDVVHVICAIADDGDFLQYCPLWATNLVCGFARLNGQPIGIVANQPKELAGVLDIDSSEKGARFVRTCDVFNIPLLALVDAPGFLPGTDQEHGGIIRRGAKLLYAFCEATVPRIQVIMRKAYGGAYVVMNSKAVGADLAYAWPSAEVAVMSPDAAVEVLYHRELDEAEDRGRLSAELVAEYADSLANPWVAAERGYVDDVIESAATRATLIEALALLGTARPELPRRKHANVPL